MKTHNSIILKFWIESDINTLCDWTQVSLIFSASQVVLESIVKIGSNECQYGSCIKSISDKDSR